MIEIVEKDDTVRRQQKLQLLLRRGVEFDSALTAQVTDILNEVKTRGDAALIDYTAQFDGIKLEREELRVNEETLERSAATVDLNVLTALRRAIQNVRAFHERQIERGWEIGAAPGIMLGQLVRPIESVGLYVPGGTAAYPSSVIMNVIPAQVAGVPRVAVTTSARNVRSNSAVAAALQELKISEVYSISGAQAIGALAYGTETVPAVHKITGPGNRFVTAAKKLVFGTVGIDSLAGPTEVVIIADESARPEFIAADLLAQAEHGDDAAAILLTNSKHLAEAVAIEIRQGVGSLARAEIVQKSLDRFGLILITDNIDESCAIANQLAPEHVQVMTKNADKDAGEIKHAGTIFIGSDTPTALGDYFAGPNHVLPTGGAARFSSPLGVSDFMKRTNVVRYSQEAMRLSAASVATLATVEGLQAHAQSALIRLDEVR